MIATGGHYSTGSLTLFAPGLTGQPYVDVLFPDDAPRQFRIDFLNVQMIAQQSFQPGMIGAGTEGPPGPPGESVSAVEVGPEGPPIDADPNTIYYTSGDPTGAAAVAYGGFRLAQAPVPGPDILQNWAKIDGFNEDVVPPVGTVFDLDNDWFKIIQPGIYNLSVMFSFQHNVRSGANPREFHVRFRNLDSGEVSRPLITVTGASDRVTSLSASFLFPVQPNAANHRVILECAAPIGDYADVQWFSKTLSVLRVAPI